MKQRLISVPSSMHLPVSTHHAANRLYSLIERCVYLGARSAGATPREAYRKARTTQRREERRARRQR